MFLSRALHAFQSYWIPDTQISEQTAAEGTAFVQPFSKLRVSALLVLSTPSAQHASWGKVARKKKKTLSDPFICNHSGVDLALLSVPAGELKRSSNSYYKAINLWVLTYASPLAICFSGEGWLLSCSAKCLLGIPNVTLPPSAVNKYCTKWQEDAMTVWNSLTVKC